MWEKSNKLRLFSQLTVTYSNYSSIANQLVICLHVITFYKITSDNSLVNITSYITCNLSKTKMHLQKVCVKGHFYSFSFLVMRDWKLLMDFCKPSGSRPAVFLATATILTMTSKYLIVASLCFSRVVCILSKNTW